MREERMLPALNAAFTKGPWREGVDGNNRVYAPDGLGPDSGTLAVVYGSTSDRLRANIRLIAAAPELMEACLWLTNLAHGIGKSGGGPEDGEYEAAAKAGLAAISKVWGEGVP